LVVDPGAYENYVERLIKSRDDKYKIAYKENTKPGSGNFFRNKSKQRLLDQVLITDMDEHKRKKIVHIKSLDKVMKNFYNLATITTS